MENNNNETSFTLAGTGHRPGKYFSYSVEDFNKLVEIARQTLELYKPSKIISGVAQGWDLALAQACIDLNIPFIAAVPFIGQEKIWPEKAKNKYKMILSKAEKVVIVSEGDFSIKKLMIRNQWMVDNCDAIIALYNEEEKSGGTYNCIQYAKQKNKQVINVWNIFKEKFYEDNKS